MLLLCYLICSSTPVLARRGIFGIDRCRVPGRLDQIRTSSILSSLSNSSSRVLFSHLPNPRCPHFSLPTTTPKPPQWLLQLLKKNSSAALRSIVALPSRAPVVAASRMVQLLLSMCKLNMDKKSIVRASANGVINWQRQDPYPA